MHQAEPQSVMTCEEAIAAVRAGGRCNTGTTIHGLTPPTPTASDLSWRCVHRWRTVACDNETDVIECSDCGEQRLCKCDFDEEYA